MGLFIQIYLLMFFLSFSSYLTYKLLLFTRALGQCELDFMQSCDEVWLAATSRTNINIDYADSNY